MWRNCEEHNFTNYYEAARKPKARARVCCARVCARWVSDGELGLVFNESSAGPGLRDSTLENNAAWQIRLALDPKSHTNTMKAGTSF